MIFNDLIRKKTIQLIFKIFFISLLFILITLGCNQETHPTPTPDHIVEEIVFKLITDNGRTYKSKDFFDVGFNKYKEYNVSKLTGATEAWYGYWGPDENSVKYYELRFYPNHSTAVSEGTPFAEDVIGEDAKLERNDKPMWRVGLPDRKLSCSRTLSNRKIDNYYGSKKSCPKYGSFLIFSNVVLLCEGVDSKQAYKSCSYLLDQLSQ